MVIEWFVVDLFGCYVGEFFFDCVCLCFCLVGGGFCDVKVDEFDYVIVVYEYVVGCDIMVD